MMDMNLLNTLSSMKTLGGGISRWKPLVRPLAAKPLSTAWTSCHSSESFSTKTFKSAASSEASTADDSNPRIIETELRMEAEKSYLAYAMSVIVGRALPDVRDGLKPVHRRILFAMHELGLSPNKPFRKCARVVGEVLGKFHPHGDTAVYDALVRLAQDFSMQIPLVDGHGNFGSIDDDPAAAMRYTECRLQNFASSTLLSDLESDTVDFNPNFDASVMEPSVLPSRVPNLLVNGSSGIAVGIATKIPPHNLSEVYNGLKALIDNPDITIADLMKHIPAPDFPTGGELIMGEGVKTAYTEGRGSITVRAKMHIEEGDSKKKRSNATGNSKSLVVITELPYQTYKAALVEQIAKLVDAGVITGVSDVRDESDREGMRMVIEVRRGSSAQLVMNQLMKHTAIQSRFSANMVALVDGLPRTLNLKEFLFHFLEFRSSVVKRRAQYDLDKASKRRHLVDGFLRAMNNLDKVVETVRKAADTVAANNALQSQIGLTKEQAEGVLGLTLRRLTSLEANKLQEEHRELQTRIADLTDLLSKRERILRVVQTEAEEAALKFGTPRRTQILREGSDVELRVEDIIQNAPSLIMYSKKGYIKRMNIDTFASQGRGGTGKAGARLKDDDNVEDVLSVSNHDHLLFFSDEGQAYSLRAYDVPEASRTSSGTAMAQILPIRSSAVAAVLPVSNFEDAMYLVMLTRNGFIKRTPLEQFAKINSRGISALKVREGDELQFVALCRASDSILITGSHGVALHFAAEKLRAQTRMGAGIRSMVVPEHAQLVGMSILPAGSVQEAEEDEEEDDIAMEDEAEYSEDVDVPAVLILTAKGYGKRTPLAEYRLRGRVGLGIKAAKLSNDDVLVASAIVTDSKGTDLVVSTENGVLVRVPMSSISLQSRSSRGSRVVKLRPGDRVKAATKVERHGEEME